MICLILDSLVILRLTQPDTVFGVRDFTSTLPLSLKGEGIALNLPISMSKMETWKW